MDRACSHRIAQKDSESSSQCATAYTTYCINVAIKQRTESGPMCHMHDASQRILAQTLTCLASSCMVSHLKYGIETAMHIHSQMSDLYNILPPLRCIQDGSSSRKIKRPLSPDLRSATAVIIPEPVNDQHLFLSLQVLAQLPINKAFV